MPASYNFFSILVQCTITLLTFITLHHHNQDNYRLVVEWIEHLLLKQWTRFDFRSVQTIHYKIVILEFPCMTFCQIRDRVKPPPCVVDSFIFDRWLPIDRKASATETVDCGRFLAQSNQTIKIGIHTFPT